MKFVLPLAIVHIHDVTKIDMNSLKLIPLTILLAIWLTQPAYSDNRPVRDIAGERHTIALDLSIATGFMTAWGIAQWDWFQHTPKFKQEGWFGADTHAGGADKTGHFYMSYVLSDILLADFRRNDVKNPEQKAALTALAAMTVLEIGDATSSKYGFSAEDWIADAGGVMASWWLAKNPEWDDLIDIRMEYWPSAGFALDGDIASDYTGMKHLIAFRGDAVNSLRHTPLGLLELQTGYYTRGFRTFDTPLDNGPERHFFVGVGLSLPTLFASNKVASTVAKYLQTPHFQLNSSWKF